MGPRLTAVLLGAAAIMVAAPAAALADSSQALVSATVVTADGSVSPAQTVTGAALASCPEGTPYTGTDPFIENTASGGSQSVTLISTSPDADQGTWPLLSALRCLSDPVQLDQISSVVVYKGTTPETRLSQQDLDPGGSDFEDPTEVPVVQLGRITGGTQYDRPARGDSDADYSDEIGDVGPVNVRVYELGTFPVTVTPSQTTVSAGGTVAFSASWDADQVPAGDALTYAWNFDGGAPDSAQPSPSVRFGTAGSYPVQLTVTDSTAHTVGVSQPLTIAVTGEAEDSAPSGTVTGPVAGTGTAPGGPAQSPGTTPGAPARSRTVSTGSTTRPLAGADTTPSTSPHVTAPSQGTPTTSPRSQPVRTTTTETTTTPPARGARAGGGGGGSAASTSGGTGSTAGSPHAGSVSASHAGTPAPGDRAPRTGTQGPRRGRRVDGLLISGVIPLTASANPLAQASPSGGSAPALGARHSGFPWGVVGPVLVSLVLLCCGVAQESRGRRGFRGLRLRAPTA